MTTIIERHEIDGGIINQDIGVGDDILNNPYVYHFGPPGNSIDERGQLEEETDLTNEDTSGNVDVFNNPYIYHFGPPGDEVVDCFG